MTSLVRPLQFSLIFVRSSTRTLRKPTSRNLLFPVPSLTEGGVWCELAGGDVPFEPQGQVLCYLDAPNSRRATLPWRGERCVLVGYTAKGAAHMSSETRTFLQRLEFPAAPALVPKSCPSPSKPRSVVAPTGQPVFVEIFAGVSGSRDIAKPRASKCWPRTPRRILTTLSFRSLS